MDGMTDLAFGMFTIFIEQQLEKEETCLYREVEAGIDLTACCGTFLAVFTERYPPLAPALAMLGTAADIAKLYAAGEGIAPTKTTKSFWIQQSRPGVDGNWGNKCGRSGKVADLSCARGGRRRMAEGT
ncbi:MAG TPA: hypothetical protein O0X23_05025 [Methanocorpusculum sp.]|nr:hypothetical protein [Methanocorpusculum sp.]